eukprot:m.172084 g.172084  ORF g.172084 m.172084 type:complete len:207 (+) comp39078_c0_seq15:389-1009(+)
MHSATQRYRSKSHVIKQRSESMITDLPNLYVASFGKILFTSCDFAVGIIIDRSLASSGIHNKIRKRCVCFWLFNPLTLTVSTRGNAESILGLLVLLSIYWLQQKRTILAGLVYGTAIHFKLYPVIYFPSFWLCLDQKDRNTALIRKMWPNHAKVLFTLSTFFSLACFTVFMYSWYGHDFVDGTLLQKGHSTQLFSIFLHVLFDIRI